MALGGRVAEEIVFGQLTTGASNDIKQATRLARAMVCELGMSEKLGPLAYGENEESVFLGRELDHAPRGLLGSRPRSEIDEEVRRIVDEQYAASRASSSRTTARSSSASPRRCSSARRSTPRRSKRVARGPRAPAAPARHHPDLRREAQKAKAEKKRPRQHLRRAEARP